MPLTSPDGYLDFTNAVPRAVKMVATSNVGIGTSSPIYALDVHGTSNTGPLTVSSLTLANGAIEGDLNISGNLVYTSNTTTIVNSNVVVEYTGPHGRDPKEVALKKYPEIAFDDTSKMDMGEGGTTNGLLFKQAGYTITASSTHSSNGRVPYLAFNGDHTTGWICASSSWNAGTNVYQGGRGIGGYSGEWIKLELPHKIKVETMYIEADLNSGRRPLTGKLLGSDDDSTWAIIKDLTSIPNQDRNNLNIGSTVAYKYIAFLTETIPSGNDTVWIDEIEYYGYEEDPPAGDTSVDTTFTSVMNTPQTTGANVYVDGKMSSGFTNQVTGPDATGTETTYDSTGKYWELTGELTSNISVEANTFLEGDQPHAVSVWFNSSNLEANTANTCVFTISDQENLDSYNLDLQSNTWHNLTYAYQGEGGSRVTYLDGRKVVEDQAEDTFGDYPPFAMTGYSQGGYVVSTNNFYTAANNERDPWRAYDGLTDSDSTNCWGTKTVDSFQTSGEGLAQNNTSGNPDTFIDETGTLHTGHWNKIELPHKLQVDYISIYCELNDLRVPGKVAILGSNDDEKWYLLKDVTTNLDFTTATPQVVPMENNKNKGFKYLILVVKTVPSLNGAVTIREISYYGHRENDLVRLPDPTNVLKYPHIAMTGPAQRGYVASASSYYNSGTEPEHGFDGVLTSDGLNHTWESGPRTGSGGGRYTPGGTFDTSYLNEVPPLGEGGFQTTETSNTWTGEWLQIELPHSINTTKYVFGNADGNSQWNDRIPTSGVILGSTNGSTWNLVHQFSSTLKDQTLTISHTGYYKYFRLIGTTVGGTQTIILIPEWELYGTEEATPVPIQIGGGNIDKVANFRIYDKFIEEDQALEIWDAQKDVFREVKNSMTLHKGRLGIGTTEPEGRLVVADEPHNFEEFPPRAMTGYKTYFEGHGEFCASSGDSDPNDAWSSSTGLGVLFDKGNTQADTHYYRTSSSSFDSGTGYYIGSNSIGGISGAWVRIDFPYRAKIQSMNILTRSDEYNGRAPRDGYLLGKNSDEDEWTIVHEWTEAFYYRFIERKFTIEASKYYSSYALVATRLLSAAVSDGTQSTNTDRMNISEWKLFGYREQGQSVLHDGQLTLTKNLTVPRIGPALDADDTPRRDRLVVEYNTSTNPTFEGAIRDTSGRGKDGVFINGASYDATEKALVFDGTDDYIVSGALGIPPGAFVHSVSLWFKRDSLGSNMYLTTIGGDSAPTNTRFSAMLQDSPAEANIHLSISGSNSYFSSGITTGVWFHLVYTYNGGAQGSASTAHNVYVNGVKKSISGGTGSGTLDLPENSRVALGSLTYGGSNYLDGSISNFKLYDKILTAEEAKTLYDMGRCDEGHHVVNFSKTRVGIGLGDGEAPRSALDVRDLIYAESSTVQTFTGQHKCVPEDPVEKGLIVSAKKNRFVKLNGGLETGKSAITIDESLPVVSLSSVVKDKACFGVVSSMEEANSLVRVETVGGVISDAPKTLGDNRAIVNSVGEGAIWVVNTGGSLESGDYITTSNVVGYGQKQDDDVLHNYTVAKITMDCDFTATEVPLQVIKREQTGLRTITEDTWNELVDYDRSSNTETQYSHTLEPEAYTDQPGYTPREVTTIVDYTDGTNTISVEEWSNLESNIQNTYQSNTFTEIVDYIKFVTADEWSNLTSNVQNTFSEAEITTYYQIQRGENVLDENGQLQWEDKTGATEAPYERRFLDASGVQTDEANAVHIAAFVGCTYHCG